MKDPAFLFYPESFLTGVTDLTMEERGQFITLLCLQHQKGVISEKTIRLSVGNVSVDVMSKFIKTEQGEYYNERLRVEIEKRLSFVDSRRENGKKGGRPEKPNGLPSVKPNGKAKNKLPINRDINIDKDIIIPELSEFVSYAKTLSIYKPTLDYSIEAKYNSWKEDGWKDGNGKNIVNWKTKLQNTLPHLKEVQSQNQQQQTIKMPPSIYKNL